MSSYLSYKSSYSSTSSSIKSHHSNNNNNPSMVDNLSHEFYYKNAIMDQQQDNVHPTATSTSILNHKLPISAKDRLESLLRQVDDENLSLMLQSEYKNMMVDQQRLATMLEQRAELLENENEELKCIIQDSQKKYEKAVREMQFFKKKYESIKQQGSSAIQNFVNLTPSSSPQPAALKSSNESVYSHHSSSRGDNYVWPTSPTTSIAPSMLSVEHQHHTMSTPLTSRRARTNSNTAASIYSVMSGSTESSSLYRYDEKSLSRQPQQQQQQNNYHFQRNPSMASSWSSPSTAPSMISGASSIMSVPPPSPVTPMTPVRSYTSTSQGHTGNSMIQQRRTDPLTFGGSDALWDTISKSSGSDVTVEKIISNFLRRGGLPNTAKQSPSSHAVKYGYGMIHALIVTKAPGSLDLLLQQGANPNVVSISQVDEEKVSPCYLAASIGWLVGLEKVVQAGGDLMSARGCGSKKKTALHVAAEHGHAAVVEYIVNMTQGVLNLETDAMGANTLHYACASGHTDLVSFIIKVCQTPINEADDRGEYPIHWAVKNGKTEVVTLLVERYGCDVNAYTTKKTGTPYEVAKSAGYKKLAEYLKSMGGITAKKMDKKSEEELTAQVPKHLESVLAKNGLMDFGF